MITTRELLSKKTIKEPIPFLLTEQEARDSSALRRIPGWCRGKKEASQYTMCSANPQVVEQSLGVHFSWCNLEQSLASSRIEGGRKEA